MRVFDEKGLGLNSLDKDPIANSIAEGLKLSMAEIKELANTIKSIKVSAIKAV